MIGQRFGSLLILADAGKDRHWHKLVACRCDCGKEFSARRVNVEKGLTTRCNDCHNEWCRVEKTKYTNPLAPKLRDLWSNMKRRCELATTHCYPRYGGRGIAVCERWQDFDNFFADMSPAYKPGLTLDRIDNDAGYSPANCRWATRKEQQRNRRCVKTLVVNGATITAPEVDEILNLPSGTTSDRLRAGWSVEKLLTTHYQAPRPPHEW